MDQDTAHVLFREGAVFIFQNVPEGTEFGIDCNSWTTGPNFRGVKMIPPGLHFVYYSARGRDGQTAPRSGFFYDFQSRDIVCRSWDPLLEDMSGEEAPPDQVEQLRAGKQELDRYLAPYPYDRYKQWVSLTTQLPPPLARRLSPEAGRIRAAAQLVSEASDSAARLARPALTSLPDMAEVEGTGLRFTPFPRQGYPAGATPADMTKWSLDSSHKLQMMVEASGGPQDGLCILGELQFAFICFLCGQSYDAFEHWKRLLHLVTSADQALVTNPAFFLALVQTLHYHLREIPEDFFVDIVSSNNFLLVSLRTFFANVEENEGASGKLKGRVAKFKAHLTSKFGWDFDLDTDEDAPVVIS